MRQSRQSIELRSDWPVEEEDRDVYDDRDLFEDLMSRERHTATTKNLIIFLIFGLLTGLAGGIFYAVGVFAADLKTIEGYSQTGVNLVSAIAYAGGITPLFVSPFIDDGTGDAS